MQLSVFSLKYEPHMKIRRNANQIEDLLKEHYGVPQVMPIPDDFAAEAPRVVFTSHKAHSQISFSIARQYSIKASLSLRVRLHGTKFANPASCGFAY